MKHFIRLKLRKLTAAGLTFIMAATFAVPFFAYPDQLMADTQDDLDAVNKQLEELRNKQSELNASYGELNEKLSASGEKSPLLKMRLMPSRLKLSALMKI